MRVEPRFQLTLERVGKLLVAFGDQGQDIEELPFPLQFTLFLLQFSFFSRVILSLSIDLETHFMWSLLRQSLLAESSGPSMWRGFQGVWMLPKWSAPRLDGGQWPLPIAEAGNGGVIGSWYSFSVNQAAS